MEHRITHQIRSQEVAGRNVWYPVAVCSCGAERGGMYHQPNGKSRRQAWEAARNAGRRHLEEMDRQAKIAADPFFGI